MITNFTVGPSKLYPGVADFISEMLKSEFSQISHRSKEFSQASEKTLNSLRVFFEIPDDYRVFYTYSATEGMEILMRNCVDKNSYHIVNGNFGGVWAKTGKASGKDVTILKNDDGSKIDVEQINPPAETEFVAITANETSTGIAYSPDEIVKIKARISQETLLGVDITSSMGMVKYDWTQADGWFFSVQKGLGLPAGLGILIVGPRAWEKGQTQKELTNNVGCHHSFSGLEGKMAGKFQTPTTPNFLDIAGLGFVSEELKSKFENIEKLYQDTQIKYKFLQDFFSKQDNLSINGDSETIIVVNCKDPVYLISELGKKEIKVSTGYGKNKATQIRIGNFPVHSMADMKNLTEHIAGIISE